MVSLAAVQPPANNLARVSPGHDSSWVERRSGSGRSSIGLDARSACVRDDAGGSVRALDLTAAIARARDGDACVARMGV